MNRWAERLALLLMVSLGQAADVRFSAIIDKDEVSTVGRVALTLEAETPLDYRVQFPDPTWPGAPWYVAKRGDVEQLLAGKDRVQHRQRLELEPGLAGTNTVPAAEMAVLMPSGLERTYRADPMEVLVFSVLEVPPWDAKLAPMIAESPRGSLFSPTMRILSFFLLMPLVPVVSLVVVALCLLGFQKEAGPKQTPSGRARSTLRRMLEGPEEDIDLDRLAVLIRKAFPFQKLPNVSEPLDHLRFGMRAPDPEARDLVLSALRKSLKGGAV